MDNSEGPPKDISSSSILPGEINITPPKSGVKGQEPRGLFGKRGGGKDTEQKLEGGTVQTEEQRRIEAAQARTRRIGEQLAPGVRETALNQAGDDLRNARIQQVSEAKAAVTKKPIKPTKEQVTQIINAVRRR